jgi:hypothetical protein
MSIVPIVVISNTAHGASNGAYNGTDTTWYSTAYKGDGYYGYTDGLHTVSYKLTGFVGIIGFQASLATTPTSADWFDIEDSQVGNAVTPTTISTFKNFSGNFVWVRTAITSFTAGTINRVLYN